MLNLLIHRKVCFKFRPLVTSDNKLVPTVESELLAFGLCRGFALILLINFLPLTFVVFQNMNLKPVKTLREKKVALLKCLPPSFGSPS